MQRLCSRPRKLAQRLVSAREIVFLCQGNIIRSDYAGERLRARLGARATIRVRSAGLAAQEGRPAHPLAVAEARRRQIDLAFHRSTSLGSTDGDTWIVAMESSHVRQLSKRDPGTVSRTLLLGCFLPGGPAELPDPYGYGPKVFEERFDQIDAAVEVLAETLQENDD